VRPPACCDSPLLLTGTSSCTACTCLQVVQATQSGVSMSVDLCSSAFLQAQPLGATAADMLASLPAAQHMLNAQAQPPPPPPEASASFFGAPLGGSQVLGSGAGAWDPVGTSQGLGLGASGSLSLPAASGGSGSFSSTSSTNTCTSMQLGATATSAGAASPVPGQGLGVDLGRLSAEALTRLLAGVRLDVQLASGVQLAGRRMRCLSHQAAEVLHCGQHETLAAAAGGGAAGGSRTAAAWYAEAGVQLQQPYMPCVDVGSEPGQPVWVPLEACR